VASWQIIHPRIALIRIFSEVFIDVDSLFKKGAKEELTGSGEE